MLSAVFGAEAATLPQDERARSVSVAAIARTQPAATQRLSRNGDLMTTMPRV
jgi:hypothetical protein